jgi:hypothetical protein
MEIKIISEALEFCSQKARIKMVFITRFDKQCVIHKAHLPQGKPVNSKAREL